MIEVAPYRPRCVITKREIDGGQYIIKRDGKMVAFIGYHEGAEPVFHVKVSPMEAAEIRDEVEKQLQDLQSVGPNTAIVPDRPTDPKPEQPSRIIVDDFN